MKSWTAEDNRLLQAGRIAPVELDTDEQERARPHTIIVKRDGREMYVPHEDYYVALNWLVANSGRYEFVRIEPTDSTGSTEPRLADASE